MNAGFRQETCCFHRLVKKQITIPENKIAPAIKRSCQTNTKRRLPPRSILLPKRKPNIYLLFRRDTLAKPSFLNILCFIITPLFKFSQYEIIFSFVLALCRSSRQFVLIVVSCGHAPHPGITFFQLCQAGRKGMCILQFIVAID